MVNKKNIPNMLFADNKLCLHEAVNHSKRMVGT